MPDRAGDIAHYEGTGWVCSVRADEGFWALGFASTFIAAQTNHDKLSSANPHRLPGAQRWSARLACTRPELYPQPNHKRTKAKQSK